MSDLSLLANLMAQAREDTAPEPTPVRYRLIAARGRGEPRRHVWGTAHEIQNFARDFSSEIQGPVVVCSAPVDGIVKQLYIVVGEDAKGRKR